MGGKEQAVHDSPEYRQIRRFPIEDVQSGIAGPANSEAAGQCRFVDESATCGVDENAVWFESLDYALVDYCRAIR
jgi:hypothetical protein